jgi:hypothetical protein
MRRRHRPLGLRRNGRKDGIQQTRKARVQIGSAQSIHQRRSMTAGRDDSAFAQHTKVMG